MFGRTRGALRSGSVARNLLTVFSGTTSAQLIGLLVLPILGRSFAPAAFGSFQIYASLLACLTAGVCFRIELTILSVADDAVVRTQQMLNVLVIVVSMLVMLLLVLLSQYGAVPLIGTLPFPPWMIGPALMANGLVLVFTYRVTREHQFKRIVTTRIVQSAVYAIVALAFAFSWRSLTGIIVADLIGRLASLVPIAVMLGREGVGLPRPAQLMRLPAFLREHRQLPLVALPGTLANNFGAAITPFMMFATYGAAVTGQYSLLERTLSLPLGMVSMASSQVFAAKLSSHLREGDAEAVSIFTKTALFCLAVGIGGALLAFPLLPFLFTFVYGPQWHQAADFSRIMVFAYAVIFPAGVTWSTLYMMRRYKTQAAWDFLWPCVLGLTWLIIRTAQLPPRDAVIGHALSMVVLQGSFLVISGLSLRRMVRERPDPLDGKTA